MHTSLSLAKQLGALPQLSKKVEELRLHWRLDQKAATHLELVLEEMVSNIIKYSSNQTGTVDISIHRQGQEITIIISDEGPPFDMTRQPGPNTAAPLEKRQCGGLGVHLVRNLCSRCSYERVGSRNILTLKKTIPEEPAPPSKGQ